MITIPDYFSYTQFSLFQKSVTQFHKRYVLGEKDKPNMYFEKGKVLAKALETKQIPEWNDDEMLPMLIQTLPSLEFPEDKFEVELSEDLKLLGYFDGSNSSYTKIIEYKTSKNPYTQEMVDLLEQLLFYALMVYKKKGIIPEIKLVWIETIETEVEGYKKLFFTGRWDSFDRIVTEDELLRFENKVKDIWVDIQNYEYKDAEIDFTIIEEYKDLLNKQKEIKIKLDDIKDIVKDLLTADNAVRGGNENGQFQIVEKKTWTYSQDVQAAEATFKREINKIKTAEKKDGIAKQEVQTTYIKFTGK